MQYWARHALLSPLAPPSPLLLPHLSQSRRRGQAGGGGKQAAGASRRWGQAGGGGKQAAGASHLIDEWRDGVEASPRRDGAVGQVTIPWASRHARRHHTDPTATAEGRRPERGRHTKRGEAIIVAAEHTDALRHSWRHESAASASREAWHEATRHQATRHAKSVRPRASLRLPLRLLCRPLRLCVRAPESDEHGGGRGGGSGLGAEVCLVVARPEQIIVCEITQCHT